MRRPRSAGQGSISASTAATAGRVRTAIPSAILRVGSSAAQSGPIIRWANSCSARKATGIRPISPTPRRTRSSPITWTSTRSSPPARAGVAFDRALIFVTGGYAGVERTRLSPYSTALAAPRTPGSAAARSEGASNTRSPTTLLQRWNTFTCRCRAPPTSARQSGRSARRTTSACSAPASTTNSEPSERRRLGREARRRASGPHEPVEPGDEARTGSRCSPTFTPI